MITFIAHGFQQESTSADSQREKDVYTLYSLMMTNPQTSHGADNNERYLIAVTTAPPHPPKPCVAPPKEREAEFREVLADYDRRKGTPRQLERALSISKPYLLLTADEVKEFMKSRPVTKTDQEGGSEQFRGVTDVFTLADVYFNERRTLALTAISSWCGSLCQMVVEGLRERL